MDTSSTTSRYTWTALLVCVAVLTPAPLIAQQSTRTKAPAAPTASEAKAHALLMKMAEFLGGAQQFSVNVLAGYDSVQVSGQKIEFNESRKLVLLRPDRLRVESQRSDGAQSVTVFDGKEITLLDAANNVYAKTAQTGNVDASIVHVVRDLGLRLPLAMMLVSQLPQELKDRVRSVDYVETTRLNGNVSHHLAARGDTVDFQVWVADGDKPLPQRVVLTYKKAAGQPQYWAMFADWNLAPAISDATFSVKAPEGSQKVAFAAQLSRLSSKGSKVTPVKGAQ
jgi:hypothetical protein